MRSQIGIYRETDDDYEHWAGLISLDSPLGPRDLLAELAPFLRRFHCGHGMEDAGGLAAWLAWKLVDMRDGGDASFGGITLERLPRLAETGVDLVSVGALTHSAPSVDLSLLFEFEG